MLQTGSRTTVISCLLGCLALGANLAGHDWLVAPGAFFIFVAAIAYGLQGAACASIVGALPLILVGGGFFPAIRLTLLALIVGAWQQFGWRRPAVVAVGLAWSACVGLALGMEYAVPELGGVFADQEARAMLVAFMLNDLLAATAASALLTTDFAWFALVKRSRIPSITNYALLFITASALLTLTACVGLGWGFAVSPAGALGFFSIACTAAILPTVVFHLLGKIPSRSSGLVQRSGLTLTGDRDHGFSGQSAMFWRRREITGLFERSSSDAQISSAQGQRSGFGPDYGVCVLDGTGAITLANRKFLKLTGCAEREPAGKPFTQCALTPEISRTFAQLVMHPSPLKRTREVRLPNTKVGSDRFFELCVVPSALAPGSLQGEPGTVVLTIREVTDSRAIESRLLQSQKLASLGSVVTGIGHAFNSALTTIVGRASYARAAKDSAIVSQGLDAIIEEAQRAGVFVSKLIDFANDSSRAKVLFDTRHFVVERKELFRNVLGTEHVLEVNLPERALGVACDPNLLTQAITNLILNAREAMIGKAGRMTLSLGLETIDPDAALLNVSSYPGTFVRIRVADTGHGMSPEVLQHACEPSYTTRSATGHSGLGLPTAFAVARAHDGFLTIESSEARGTNISMYLPEAQLAHTVQGPGAEVNAEAAQLDAQPSQNGPRVLVVEDEPNVRELVAGMLRSLGAFVVTCEKPQEGLAIAQTKPFDVAFVDLVMPTMGGNEWVEHLRSQQKGASVLPVVLMTGHGISVHRDASIHSVLPKPFTLKDLEETLKSAARLK